MASVVERTTAAGERRLYITFHARDRATGKRRKVWELVPPVVSGEDGKPKPSGKREANGRKAQIELALQASRGVWPAEAEQPPERAQTLAEYVESWKAVHGPKLRPQTLDEYQRILERDLLPRFGALLLADIRRSDVRALMAERAANGSAANTIRNIIAPLRAILAQAVDDELIPSNPAAGLKRTGREAKRVKPPTSEQVARLIQHARPEFKVVLQLAASLGLRRGEVYGLRWCDVDFEKRVVRVEQSNIDGTLMHPKTDAGARYVPLFGSASKVLAAWKLQQPAEFTQPDSLIFPDPFGRPQNTATVPDREMQHALRASKLGERSMRFHDLRHFAVSQLIGQGANILQVARVAGHSDPAVTLRVYAHLFRDGLSEAAEKYDPLRVAAGV